MYQYLKMMRMEQKYIYNRSLAHMLATQRDAGSNPAISTKRINDMGMTGIDREIRTYGDHQRLTGEQVELAMAA